MNFSKVILFSLGLLLTACQTVPYQGVARDVKKKPKKSGVISVPVNPRAEDNQVAQRKMKTNCAPYPYEVIEEGEVVVGQKVNSSTTERKQSDIVMGSLFGIRSTPNKKENTSSVTEALKEWHITYKCDKRATAKK